MDPRINALLLTYPFLDHLMAETLLKMSDGGKLNSFMQSIPEQMPTPTSSVIEGAITVDNDFSPPLTVTHP